MKKLISILLVVVMLVAMVPAMAFTTSAATTPSGSWADSGNYDLSWASSIIKTTTSDNTVTVDGVIYNVVGQNGTFTIADEADLAGLAKLSNAANKQVFNGATFKLTAESYNLSAHYWDPISNHINKKFRASLVSDNGTTIDGMTVLSTSTDNNGCYGLIGNAGNGSVKNITLTNATITVAAGCVGSFTGDMDSTSNGTIYENLKSDAHITHESAVNPDTGKHYAAENAWTSAGGIMGTHRNSGTDRTLTFKNCVFTGIIDAPTANNVGGILAVNRPNCPVTIEKCVVASELFRFGAQRHSGDGYIWGGMGGVVGINNGGTLSVKETYVSIDNFSVLYEEDASSAQQPCIGGMVGNVGTAVSFTNCQIDMLGINGNMSSHHGAFTGRHANAVTIGSCVNSGAFASIGGTGWNGVNTFRWVAGGNTFTDGGNNFASFEQRYKNDYTTTTPTVIESVETWKTTLDSNVWSEREGSIYPILKVAKDYAQYSVSGAGVDYSFFNVAGCKVTTQEELNAMANISYMMGNYGSSTHLMAASGTNATRVVISPALATADMTGYNATFKNSVNAKLGVANKVDDGTIFDVENTDGNDDAVFAQVSLEKNENNLYDIRFVITVNDISACDGVMFEVAASRGDKFGAFLESDVVINAYKTVVEITADGEVEHTAEGDAYYVICVVNNVDLSAETTFTVRANAVTVEGKTTTLIAQSAAVNFVVPAAN